MGYYRLYSLIFDLVSTSVQDTVETVGGRVPV
jgi:hypothetical protein